MRITVIPKVEKVFKKTKWNELIETAKAMSKDHTLSIQFNETGEAAESLRVSIRSAINPAGFKTFFDKERNTLYINHKK